MRGSRGAGEQWDDNRKGKRILSVLGYLLGLEWLGVGIAAPFLLFPTVRPCWTAAVLAMLATWWLLRWAVRGEPWPRTPFNVALLVLLLTIPPGIRASIAPELTLPKAAGLILGLAVFRAIAFSVQNPSHLRFVLVLFILLGFAILVVGILGAEWRTKVSALEPVIPHIPRLIGPLPELRAEAVHPNQLAGVLSLYIPLLVSLLFRPRGPHHRAKILSERIGLSLFCLLWMSTLVLTQSRSGWMGGLVGLITLPALWGSTMPRPSARWMGWGVFIIMVVTSIGALFAVGPERLRTMWEEPSVQTAIGPLNTLAFRQEVWRWALVTIGDFPLTGCGLGTFRDVARVLYPMDPSRVPPGYDIAHAHNIFLQTALDLGIPGLVAYLAILGVALAMCWRVALTLGRGKPPEAAGVGVRALALGLAAGLIALHVYGMTDALALGSKPGVVFWYALGLVAALGQMGHPLQQSPKCATMDNGRQTTDHRPLTTDG